MSYINLFSTTSRVEAPYIILTIGDYTFGVYDKTVKNNKLDENGNLYSEYHVTFPNYLTSIDIVKVNGAVNTYTISMVYAMRPGDDPNLIEKIFSSISNTRNIKISYGDYNSPTFAFKEENAIITNITSNLNASNSNIVYNITCVSEALNLTAGKFNFPARYAKPSDVLKELLYSSKYGLLEIFYGMRDKELVQTKGLILSDDKKVQLEAKTNISVFDYINYLTKCMSSITDSGNKLLKNSCYTLTVIDDYKGEFGGPYFKINKISKNVRATNSLDMYEIDIGYPGQNIVTNFTINNNETYSILYNYSGKMNQADYVYRINNEGEVSYIYSPSLSNSNELLKTTEADKNWWSLVTQYPISASLTIRGLLRPAILMSYVKINVYFYGRKHLSSGIYIITKQQDRIDGNGYSSTLTLTRVEGDDNL